MMGNYNKEYEGYYAKILERQRQVANYNHYEGNVSTGNISVGSDFGNTRSKGYSSTRYGNGKYSEDKKPFLNFSKEGLIRRIMQELVLIFVLLIVVLVSKTVNMPQTKWIYSYGKEVVDTNFDYKQLATYNYAALLKKPDLSFSNTEDIRIELENYVDTFKASLTGDKTQMDKIKESYTIPLKGKLLAEPSKLIGDKGVVIQGEIGTEVICVYDGKIKKIGEDSKLGKYVIVDHGDGVESKYSNLKEIELKEGASVGKGELIGKVDENKNLNIKGVIFQIFIMGTAREPEEYLTF